MSTSHHVSLQQLYSESDELFAELSYSVPVSLSLSELEVSLQLLSHSGKGPPVYLTALHFPFPTFHPLLVGDGSSLSSKCLKQ